MITLILSIVFALLILFFALSYCLKYGSDIQIEERDLRFEDSNEEK